MGSVYVEEGQTQAYGDGLRTFNITGLKSAHIDTPTTSREDILLFSWLLVLLRTREDGRASFEWTYENRPDDVDHQTSKILLSSEHVLTDPKLQVSIRESLEAVSRHIKTNAPALYAAKSGASSLLLSTGSLLQAADEDTNGVSEILTSLSV